MSDSHSKPESETFKKPVVPVPDKETDVFDEDARAHWHSTPESEELLENDELLPDPPAEEADEDDELLPDPPAEEADETAEKAEEEKDAGETDESSVKKISTPRKAPPPLKRTR